MMIDLLVTTAPLQPPLLPSPYEGEWLLHHYRASGLVFLALDLYVYDPIRRRRDRIRSFVATTPRDCLRMLGDWAFANDERYTLVS